ncbi:MAG: ACP S-malonyltransferase [Chloroflexi bacterium]|nr:ACP S-malonyltransferase [Chloroflexota bacterium]
MSHPDIAYLFPGQGSQHLGMGQELAELSPEARTIFQQADEALGFGLSSLCWHGPEEDLNETLNTQPALLTASIAAFAVMQARGMGKPAFVAGHSVGEFGALVAAGALSFEDGLRIVRERGRLMQDAGSRNPGAMAAILGLDAPAVESICQDAQREVGGVVGIANDNCPGQLVISGSLNTLERAMSLAEKHGARRVIRLAVSIAAHSPLMSEAADLFSEVLSSFPLQSPGIPLVANATAEPLESPQQIQEALRRQLTSPVRWNESINWMIGQGVRRFIEVGPKDVLTGLMKRIDSSVERLTTEQALQHSTTSA